MELERAGADLQTFQALTSGPAGTGAAYRRSTSSGYYSTLSPDLVRALSPDELRADASAPAPELRVLLPSLRQARGFQLEGDLSNKKVDLRLASPGKREREVVQWAQVGGHKLGSKPRAHTRLTRGTGGVYRASYPGDRHLSHGSSVITQQANSEVSMLMAAVLEGQVSVSDEQAQDLPAPTTIEEATARLHQRNLERGLHQLEEEIRAAKNHEKKAFLGKIKEPSPHLCAMPPHKGMKQSIKSKSFRQRSQELEDKLNVLRWDERKLEALQQDLQQRKAEATHLLLERGNYLTENCQRVGNGYYAFKGQEERFSSKIALDHTRASENRSKRREVLVSRKAAIVQSMEQRVERKLVYEQERLRSEMQRAKSNWQQVVLPAALAAVRIVIWSKAVHAGRALREHQARVAAANKIRTAFFMVMRKREVARQTKMRYFLRQRIWWMKIQQNIRLKRQARQVLIPYFRSHAHKRKIANAVSRYIWKIKKIQDFVRSILACRHAQLRAVMAQWDKICHVRKAIQLTKHDENTQWGGLGVPTSQDPSPAPAPQLLRQQTTNFRASLAKKKSASVTFENINFLLLPSAETPLVKALLDQALFDKRLEFANTLQEWREEYQGWQDEKAYYKLEIEAHEEMLRHGGKPAWLTHDSKKKEQPTPDTSPVTSKAGHGEGSGAEKDDIGEDGHPESSPEHLESPLATWGEDCEGSARERDVLNGDLTSEKEGAEEGEASLAQSAASPINSEKGGTRSDRGRTPTSPSSPHTPLSKGKHFRKKKKKRKEVAAEEMEKKSWDFQTWKEMPAVERYAHIRYKVEGPPRPMFHFKLSEKDEMLLLMHQVRQSVVMGPA